MFEHTDRRYVSSAIAEELHPEIMVILWRLIDTKKHLNVELDYQQVFELTESNDKQVIIHRQEVPPMKSFRILPLQDTKPINRTVWCMDMGEEGQMMLFPEDY
ncbi:DUF960 family protein [Sporosarcina sp. FSL K6-5500]|uniref:DUF960 family protein n=1 Tax=Sporosarcina sp. FSL K6-5500 TaxID=2921558 RepID=UPI0030F5C883